MKSRTKAILMVILLFGSFGMLLFLLLTGFNNLLMIPVGGIFVTMLIAAILDTMEVK